MKEQILAFAPDYPWQDRLVWLPEADSTNTRLKELARQGAPHGTALIAARQTAGHGRMGRSFHSPEGLGVYLSILLRPECPAEELMHLTCAAAVAMCDAVEQTAGFRPRIKWTNDLVYGGKKLGGILTELGLGPGGKADWAIIGIGINCCHTPEDFPEEIRPIAASLSTLCGRSVPPEKLAAAMLEALCKLDGCLLSGKDAIVDRYREDCMTVGQQISLVRGEQVRHGKAVGIDSRGALVVEFPDGSVEHIDSGEVSVRGMYGYV